MLRTAFLILILFVLAATGSLKPAPTLRSFSPSPIQSEGNPKVKVWVNTSSGVYHCPGTRWYGNTKRGEYMMQKEAQSKGYRPAYGIFCG